MRLPDSIAPQSPTLRAWNTVALGPVFAVYEGNRIRYRAAANISMRPWIIPEHRPQNMAFVVLADASSLVSLQYGSMKFAVFTLGSQCCRDISTINAPNNIVLLSKNEWVG
jgi:hypothetical protein